MPLSLGLPCTLEYEYGRGGLGAPVHGTSGCPYHASGKTGVGNMDPLCENLSYYFPPADGSLYMEVAFSRLSLFEGGAHELAATVPTRRHRDEKNTAKTCAHASAEPVLYPFLSARLARSHTNKAGEEWVRMHEVPGDAPTTRRVPWRWGTWIHKAKTDLPIFRPPTGPCTWKSLFPDYLYLGSRSRACSVGSNTTSQRREKGARDMCKCISGTGFMPLSLGSACTLEHEYGRGGLDAPEYGTRKCPYHAPGTTGVRNMDALSENRSAHFPPADGSLYMIVAFSRISFLWELGARLRRRFQHDVTQTRKISQKHVQMHQQNRSYTPFFRLA